MSIPAIATRSKPRTERTLGTVLVVGVALLAACHDEHQQDSLDSDGAAGQAGTLTGGSDGGEDDPAVERFLREYAASVCVLYRPCCLAEGRGYDGPGCTAWFQETFKKQVWGKFQAEAAEHCLVALADATAQNPARCDAVPSFNEATLRAECAAAFVPLPRAGAVLGEECNFADECASSILGDVNCFQDRCLVERRGAAGDGPCIFSSSLVAEEAEEVFRCEARDGLYCHLEHNVCEAFLDVDEPCPHLDACKSDSICLVGRCQRLPDRGDECLNTTPGLCARGSACNEANSTCGPPARAGDACSHSFACASGSCREGYCADPEFFARLSCTGQD